MKGLASLICLGILFSPFVEMARGEVGPTSTSSSIPVSETKNEGTAPDGLVNTVLETSSQEDPGISGKGGNPRVVPLSQANQRNIKFKFLKLDPLIGILLGPIGLLVSLLGVKPIMEGIPLLAPPPPPPPLQIFPSGPTTVNPYKNSNLEKIRKAPISDDEN